MDTRIVKSSSSPYCAQSKAARPESCNWTTELHILLLLVTKISLSLP